MGTGHGFGSELLASFLRWQVGCIKTDDLVVDRNIRSLLVYVLPKSELIFRLYCFKSQFFSNPP